jgi:predicted DNA-binding protein (MmcQ/YjbR family)
MARPAKKEAALAFAPFNAFCMGLKGTTYIVQWGDHSVWKVGGKVYVIGGWSKDAPACISIKVTPLAFEMLKDAPHCRPAPYLASRGMSWIQIDDGAMTRADIFAYVRESYALVAAGLTKKARLALGLDDPAAPAKSARPATPKKRARLK